jgi:uncharacterized protein GlcG (DUF336 family)
MLTGKQPKMSTQWPTAGRSPSPSSTRADYIPGPGAVVIRDGDEVLGAAGASGASGEDDRACVEAGFIAVFRRETPP